MKTIVAVIAAAAFITLVASLPANQGSLLPILNGNGNDNGNGSPNLINPESLSLNQGAAPEGGQLLALPGGDNGQDESSDGPPPTAQEAMMEDDSNLF
ncbi:hypothetical protein H4R33_005022 [Dimargaris cristalligena]|nr:hypothetical protein H4R33_005022 [Dimargaris cristalligena]